MAGRRPLKGGAVRLLGFHGGVEGVAFRRAYDALEGRYGPLDALGRLEASRAAVAWTELEAATRELMSARRKRRVGRGRRPSPLAVQRLAKRAGLADGTYMAAAKRLEDLAGSQRRKPTSMAEVLAQREAGL